MAYLQAENNIYLIQRINIINDNVNIIVSDIAYHEFTIECESEKEAHIKFREIKQLLERKAIIDLDLVKSL